MEEWGADRSFSDIEDDWNHDYGYDDFGDDNLLMTLTIIMPFEEKWGSECSSWMRARATR